MYTSKRKKTVWFLRAPPLHPPTPDQEYFRDFFRTAATDWRALTVQERDDWATAAHRLSLGLSGYCLWVWYRRTRDHGALNTIQRQSQITLALPP